MKSFDFILIAVLTVFAVIGVFSVVEINKQDHFDLTTLKEGVGIQFCDGYYIKKDFIYDQLGNTGFYTTNQTQKQFDVLLSSMKHPIRIYSWECVGKTLTYYREVKR